MFAIIRTGGKQYPVEEGDILKVEKLGKNVGDSVEFDDVLLVDDDNEVRVGNPNVDAKVSGEVLEEGRNRKLTVFTYKSKTRQRRKIGHRQHYSKVKITGLQ
ncbi:MAG: 50S ribosomal protein L21 [Parcubacteria group bacterium SW_4_49_11]|jgi:large subunit ribosomal protein L21|nr:MAG: 50S ribosomal protein L21 [Parcubacteria group bacterium SW_4_49_11]